MRGERQLAVDLNIQNREELQCKIESRKQMTEETVVKGGYSAGAENFFKYAKELS